MLRWTLKILIFFVIARLTSRWGLMALLAATTTGYLPIPDLNPYGSSELLGGASPEQRLIMRVTRVIDGDTFDVVAPNAPLGASYRIRLAKVDTPERTGSTACPIMAQKAALFLETKLASSDYLVSLDVQRRIGARWVAEAYNRQGDSVSQSLLNDRVARQYFPGASRHPWPGCH